MLLFPPFHTTFVIPYYHKSNRSNSTTVGYIRILMLLRKDGAPAGFQTSVWQQCSSWYNAVSRMESCSYFVK